MKKTITLLLALALCLSLCACGGGPVRVGGTDQEAPGAAFRNAEGHQGTAAPGHIVFPAGNQIPVVPFSKGGIAPVPEGVFQVGPGVVLAVGSVQKGAEFLDGVCHKDVPFHLSDRCLYITTPGYFRQSALQKRLFVEKH